MPALLWRLALCAGLLSPMAAFADSNVPVLAPAQYAFSATAVGSTSASHPFTLTNNGSASLHLIGGQTPAEFPDTGNNCPYDLDVGASCVFNVTFAPAAAGARTGTLTVYTASGNLVANLSGTGFDPAAPVQFSPLSYDYGTISVGGRGADHAFVLTNYGVAPVTVTGVSVSSEFTDDGNNCSLPTSLSQGASCFFNVYFSPAASGARNGTLTVATSTGNVVASLSGIGGSMDSSPTPISFAPISGVARNTVMTSNSITVAGIDTPIAVTVSGGTYAINGGSYTGAGGTVNAGDTITVRQTSAASFGTTTTATLTIGSDSDAQSADFAVTTLAADTAPDAFGFGNRDGVAPDSIQTSGSVTPAGFNDNATISVAGGLYAINGGAFTGSTGSFAPGDQVAVRLVASDQFSTTTNLQLTIGGVTGNFAVTTIAADTTPDAFAFSAANNVMPDSLQTSNTVTISGLNTGAPITVSGGSYRINGGAFTSIAGNVGSGDNVTVRQKASSSFATTTTASLTIGDGPGAVSAPFKVTTIAATDDPNAFSFGAVTGVVPGSVQTSGAIVVSGTNTASAIHISGGSYAIDGGAFTSDDGTVLPGSSVAVRTTASAEFSSTVTVTLTIGSTEGTYIVTTLAADTTPDTFIFGSINGVLPDSPQTSDTIIVSGINTGAPISIRNGLYRVNDDPYTEASGTVNVGDHVTLQTLAPSGFGETVQTTLTIGGVSGSFVVTTAPGDTTRDDKGGGGAFGSGLLAALFALGLLRRSLRTRRTRSASPSPGNHSRPGNCRYI